MSGIRRRRAGGEGEAEGARAIFCCCLFLLVENSGGANLKCRFGNSLEYGHTKKAFAVDEARELPPHGHERTRASAADAWVNAAAPPCASIAQGVEQRAMEQDYDA